MFTSPPLWPLLYIVRRGFILSLKPVCLVMHSQHTSWFFHLNNLKVHKTIIMILLFTLVRNIYLHNRRTRRVLVNLKTLYPVQFTYNRKFYTLQHEVHMNKIPFHTMRTDDSVSPLKRSGPLDIARHRSEQTTTPRVHARPYRSDKRANEEIRLNVINVHVRVKETSMFSSDEPI